MPSAGAAGPFRHLDEAKVLRTLARLRDRIAERFPDSGLAGVAAALLVLGEGTADRVERLRRPHWPLRIAGGAAVLALTGLLLGLFAVFGLPVGMDGVADLVQSTEAALNALVLVGAAVFFLVTLETRLKRREALAALHAEHLNDPVVLAAVNDLESLTEGLSAKIWQKITLLGREAP